jgi:SAM-dependent methyltransferase
MNVDDEPNAVLERYARRAATGRYSMLKSDVWQTVQERQRAMLRLFVKLGFNDLSALRLLEVGCGSGGNLLELLRLGFAPERLSGIELLPERFAAARAALPVALNLHEGDALQVDLPAASHDIVFVSTVFSSLLDDAFQQRLADAMWRWVRPGGGVLWYDFTVNNPRNADVRGVPLSRVRALFPQGRVLAQRVTLAPPIARAVTRVHAGLYPVFNVLPLLRTHVLAWVGKPGVPGFEPFPAKPGVVTTNEQVNEVRDAEGI